MHTRTFAPVLVLLLFIEPGRSAGPGLGGCHGLHTRALRTTREVTEEMNGRTMGPSVPGLEGVVATMTRLSMVDGEAGRLVIAGFPVEELAGRATFEETLYLLWNDALPDAGQLARLKGDLAARRALPEATTDLLGAAAASGCRRWTRSGWPPGRSGRRTGTTATTP